MDMLVLRAELSLAREAVAATEAARIMAVLAAEISAHEAAAVWDSTAVRIKDVEDRDALVEREAQDRVSRVNVENTTALASVHEDTEGLVRKVSLLEGELSEACLSRELVEENSHSLSDATADVA
jgi:hypothetical protein